jgi:Holliday junction resolvasome RuvABC DNA-binding subunit
VRVCASLCTCVSRDTHTQTKMTATKSHAHAKDEAADFSANIAALVDMGFDYKDATSALAAHKVCVCMCVCVCLNVTECCQRV